MEKLLDEYSNTGKKLEYELSMGSSVDWIYRTGKDALEASILGKSRSIASALVLYQQKKIQGDTEYYDKFIQNSETTNFTIRGLAPAIETILRDKRYTLEALKYAVNDAYVVQELEKDPKFLNLFKMYTREDYQVTPEFRKKVFGF